MRLSRFSKQIIAVVCAIAMVVAGLVFVPSKATKADAPDWSTIDYLGDGAGGGTYTNKYKFYAENGTKAVNIQHPGFAEEDGIYIGFPAADISMDIAGYAVQGAGACIYLSNFTNKVTEFTVSWAGGSTTCYVYYEDGAEGPTTTVDPSAPTTEPTTASPWKSIPNGGSQWYYNNNTKQNISNVVNIQKPGWAAEDGVYITVPAGISQVDVNGVTEGVAAIDGAGFVVYLSAMTKKINKVTITQGLGTSYIEIKNENGSEDPTTEAPTGETESQTETTTQEPTTEADHWVNVVGSNDLQYWSATDTKVISYQNPGWSGQKEAGVYVLNPDGMGAPVKVVIDGVETNVAQGDNDTFYCMGAGLLFYESTLAKPTVNVDIYYAPATTTKHELIFKNINSPMIDVTEYKAHGTYPEQAGKVFAGFYADSEFTTPYMETTGYAYAKFIDEAVLGPVKFQVANDGSAIRFLSSLDCPDYDSAGFIINGYYDGHTITNKSRAAKKLYSAVIADGEAVYPTIFSDDSNYFFTYTLSGLSADKVADMTWNVTPYFVTEDGTTVTGAAGTYPPSN